VFIGFALIPPVALKVASTGYRFVRYYTGAPAYRQKGPPPAFLRLLGPLVIVSTVVLLASGVALLFVHGPWQQRSLTIHKASFVLWFGAMTVHVVGHLFETVRLAPRDWSESRAVRVRGGAARRFALATSVVAGGLLGAWSLGHLGTWLSGR
jgi:hypothetical protein